MRIGKFNTAANATNRVGPDVKNLNGDTYGHSLQLILPVAVAIVMYFEQRVTQPPPELFRRHPALYLAQINSAGGKVLAEFLRHAGLPVMFWQRAGRSADTQLLDGLQAFALHVVRAAARRAPPPPARRPSRTAHRAAPLTLSPPALPPQFRASHKTSASQISLMHLLSMFATHPLLNARLRAALTVSPRGVRGANVFSDRSLEFQNDTQKEQGEGGHLLDKLARTAELQPMAHVHRTYKLSQCQGEPGDDGARASMPNEVDHLVALFEEKLGVDLVTPTERNPFWHTGNPTQLDSGAARAARPWDFVWSVADGLAEGGGGERPTSRRESWLEYVRRHVRDHMFYQ